MPTLEQFKELENLLHKLEATPDEISQRLKTYDHFSSSEFESFLNSLRENLSLPTDLLKKHLTKTEGNLHGVKKTFQKPNVLSKNRALSI